MTGILVIAWNSADVIGKCLDACLEIENVEILVVDNASNDRTIEEVRKRDGVRLIANTVNRGFAGAANQGIAALECPAVLLLNPDAMPLEGFSELSASAARPGAGAAGGRLIGPDGKTQNGFNIRRFPSPVSLSLEVTGINRLWPSNPWNREYRAPVDTIAETEVDQPAGAFLMVNKAAWAKVRGLDEGFHPVWFEDVDFCRRLKNAGFRILYQPRAVARHAGGHSASRLRWEDRQLFWYSSLLRYSARHFSPGGYCLVATAVMAASAPRALLGVLSGHGLRAVSVYSKVFCAACSRLLRANHGRNWPGQKSPEENRAKQFIS